tara:strand:+ start:337 stop:681 length:345 start_codon:yes stop_codon:yes gene_type:complete
MDIKNPEKLVKVDLTWDIKVSLPCVDKDGTLDFYEANVFGENSLKVLLPEEVVNDKQTLRNYLREQHEYAGDMPSYDQINIWDENKEIKEGGTFRFGWNYDGSKSHGEKITADL